MAWLQGTLFLSSSLASFEGGVLHDTFLRSVLMVTAFIIHLVMSLF